MLRTLAINLNYNLFGKNADTAAQNKKNWKRSMIYTQITKHSLTNFSHMQSVRQRSMQGPSCFIMIALYVAAVSFRFKFVAFPQPNCNLTDWSSDVFRFTCMSYHKNCSSYNELCYKILLRYMYSTFPGCRRFAFFPRAWNLTSFDWFKWLIGRATTGALLVRVTMNKTNSRDNELELTVWQK